MTMLNCTRISCVDFKVIRYTIIMISHFFFRCLQIWDQIVAHTNFSSSQFENHLKAFAAVKRTLEDRLVGRPGHPRALLADRALLQQEFRAQTGGGLTKAHADVMRDLVTLSTSRYSAVRSTYGC